MRPEQEFSSQFAKTLKRLYPAAHTCKIESSHTCSGFPDRIVLIPGGRIVLVELKVRDPGREEKYTIAQLCFHRKLRALDTPFVVLTKLPSGVILNGETLDSLDEAVIRIVEGNYGRNAEN